MINYTFLACLVNPMMVIYVICLPGGPYSENCDLCLGNAVGNAVDSHSPW